MDIRTVLRELYEERERLDQAIAAMERLAATGQRRRGRPPKWLVEVRKGNEFLTMYDALCRSAMKGSA